MTRVRCRRLFAVHLALDFNTRSTDALMLCEGGGWVAGRVAVFAEGTQRDAVLQVGMALVKQKLRPAVS